MRFSLFLVLCWGAAQASATHATELAVEPTGNVQLAELARDAYVFGLPLVFDYGLMHAFAIDEKSGRFQAPFNQLAHQKAPISPDYTGIPFPNNDTMYSSVWFDLRSEPMVIRLPRIDSDRYASLMLTDNSVLNYGLISNRQQNIAGDYLITVAGWSGEVPAGVRQVFTSTTAFSLGLLRIQLKHNNDAPAIAAIQQDVSVVPLSSYQGLSTPAAAEIVPFPAIDADLARTNFFYYLDFVLKFAPVLPEENEIRQRLAAIGIGDRNPDAFKTVFLPLATKNQDALRKGVMAGEQLIQQRIAAAKPLQAGWDWRVADLDISRDNYHGDYLKRAALFKLGPYGLNRTEAVYPFTNSLPDGELLDGSQYQYQLTFTADELPPVDTFWSLTIYNDKRLFSENSAQRYLINSLMLPELKKNADGSITIYIQRDKPASEDQKNWLPTPDGPMYLMLRLYGPKELAIDGSWSIPPVRKTHRLNNRN